jgi:drug/metabolite transporter (DMT)-like permease
MKLNNRKVYIAAAAYALITGLSFLFVKIALESSDPFDLLAYRFSVAFIAISISYAFKWINFTYSKKRMLKIIPIALLYPLSFFAFQTFGLQHASSAEGGIFLASSPIFTLILATYFLKEETTFLQKLSILISVSGVIYITVNKSTNLNYNSISIGKHLIKGTISSFFTPLTNLSFIISILYLGVLSSLGTSLMTNYILSKIEASKMSVFANLGTVITIIAGAAVLNENIYYYHIIGSVLIVGGVLGANFLDKKEAPDNLNSK